MYLLNRKSFGREILGDILHGFMDLVLNLGTF